MPSTVSVPPLPYKSAIRRMIEVWSEGKQLNNIVRLGTVHGYMVPSASEPGAYYVVVYDEANDMWACACKGFRFNKKRDSCRHVEIILEKEKEASKKWQRSKSPSKSSTVTARTRSSTAARARAGTTKSTASRRSTVSPSQAKAKSASSRRSTTSSKRSI